MKSQKKITLAILIALLGISLFGNVGNPLENPIIIIPENINVYGTQIRVCGNLFNGTVTINFRDCVGNLLLRIHNHPVTNGNFSRPVTAEAALKSTWVEIVLSSGHSAWAKTAPSVGFGNHFCHEIVPPPTFPIINQ